MASTSIQNCSFSATCETRPGCDFRIWPKVASSRLPSTAPAPSNCARLKVLKISKRNSREVDSVIRVSLCKAISQLAERSAGKWGGLNACARTPSAAARFAQTSERVERGCVGVAWTDGFVGGVGHLAEVTADKAGVSERRLLRG